MSTLQGLWIPKEYLINELLTGNERLIISYIHYKGNHQLVYDDSIRSLSRNLGIRENKVSEAIKSLIQKGFLIKLNPKTLQISSEWKASQTTDKNIPKQEIINRKIIPKRETIHSEGQRSTIPKQDIKYAEMGDKSIPKQDSIPYRKETIKKQKDELPIFNEKKIGDETKMSFKKKKESARLQEITFEASELSDFDTFEAFMTEEYPEADVNYYFTAVSKWAKTPNTQTGEIPKRKIWKSVIGVFVMGDYKKGLLVLKNHQGYGNTTQSFSSNKQKGNSTETRTGLETLLEQYFETKDWV
ncbi:hypothetical protein VB776_09935 [Arcicella sp. DC2W]|uniref:Helix-turn-helix domain-containing protein n=1 Tax=Arcicella gelida TaxID=2984195 RepID=A0ABU5S409_9BACT|nr:hypothetical protein [Arcicella sp. DC2W]MEA5403234.1 hypothetical protein [Arcicella sp. DC2W]